MKQVRERILQRVKFRCQQQITLAQLELKLGDRLRLLFPSGLGLEQDVLNGDHLFLHRVQNGFTLFILEIRLVHSRCQVFLDDADATASLVNLMLYPMHVLFVKVSHLLQLALEGSNGSPEVDFCHLEFVQLANLFQLLVTHDL